MIGIPGVVFVANAGLLSGAVAQAVDELRLVIAALLLLVEEEEAVAVLLTVAETTVVLPSIPVIASSPVEFTTLPLPVIFNAIRAHQPPISIGKFIRVNFSVVNAPVRVGPGVDLLASLASHVDKA